MYRVGRNRIYYQTSRFQDRHVQCFFYRPNGEKTDLFEFQRLDNGIYFADIEFHERGDFLGVFFEDSQQVATRVFKVQKKSFIFYEGIPLN